MISFCRRSQGGVVCHLTSGLAFGNHIDHFKNQLVNDEFLYLGLHLTGLAQTIIL